MKQYMCYVWGIMRGYYMVAQAHEFYLRVLVLHVSLMSEPSERVRDTFSANTLTRDR